MNLQQKKGEYKLLNLMSNNLLQYKLYWIINGFVLFSIKSHIFLKPIIKETINLVHIINNPKRITFNYINYSLIP